MSIVIPVGVDTADTSYLDMAAGSEWVTPTTSPNLHCSHLLCPSLPYFSHSYKPLVGLWSSSMPKVHSHLHRHCSHLSPFFGVIQNHLTPLFEKIWFPLPIFSLYAPTCPIQWLTLWLYSIPSVHTDFISHVYNVTVHEKGICSP